MTLINFYDLPQDDLVYLNLAGTIQSLSPNENLIPMNTRVTALYFVLSGLFYIKPVENTDTMILINQGEVIGEMSFLEEEAPSFSVVCLKKSSVFVIPFEKIKERIEDSPSFGAHLYHALAISLSERLRKTTEYAFKAYSLLDGVSEKESFPFLPFGPIALLDSVGHPDFSVIEKTIETLVPLKQIIRESDSNVKDMMKAFEMREHNLSVASLPRSGFQLLIEIIQNHGISLSADSFICHAPSLTANEKMITLGNIGVQKTITLKIAGTFGMITGLGDFKIDNQLLEKLRISLNLSRKTFKNCTINPKEFIPEIDLELLRGMVSCFFKPGKWTQLSFIAIIKPDDCPPNFTISLSPSESLILPSHYFFELASDYVRSAFPYLTLIHL